MTQRETNHYAISIPVLGSLIGSMSFTSKEVGLTDFPPQDRPPVLIPFFAFRIMVGCGLVMLLLAWLGSYLSVKGRLEQNRAAAVVRVSQLSAALHRDPDRLVHRRGRAPALDGLRRAADRRRDDAVPDGARGDDLARRLLRRSTASSSPSASSTSIGCCAPARSAVWSCRPQPQSPTARCRSLDERRRIGSRIDFAPGE